MLSKLLSYLQALVSADKSALVAGALALLGLLATRFGLKLNASDTAYLGALLMGLAGVFVHAHFASQPKASVVFEAKSAAPADKPASV